MSVIVESQAGDQLIIIGEFKAAPQGMRLGEGADHDFQIGERVHYVGFYRHENLKDNPVCWMVVFDVADGKRYAATQTYFLTLDDWEGIRKHFAKEARSKSKAKNKKQPVPRR